MPGYLTSMMVLIETDRWLDDLATHLEQRKKTLGKKKAKLPEIEATVLDLATKARDRLRFKYDSASMPISQLPLAFTAAPENGVGGGISCYAVSGALSPDFPAAGNILALNHTWVSDTMHKAAPLRAWKNAKSTEFALHAIDQDAAKYLNEHLDLKKDLKHSPPPTTPSELGSMESGLHQPAVAFALGHLASVASHVVVEPFIQQWAWAEDQRDRMRFVVQLDAQLAKGYYQRSDLHGGDTWTNYLFHSQGGDYGIDVVATLARYCFEKTHGEKPKDVLCSLSVKQLRDKYPVLVTLLDADKELAANFDRYSGYDDLFEGFSDASKGPRLKNAIDAVVDQKGKHLSDELKKFECKVPKVDRDFLIDGYKNTVNWALDSGYDHSPTWIRIAMAGAVLLVTAVPFGLKPPVLPLIGSVYQVWSNVEDFGPPLGDWSLFGSTSIKGDFDSLKTTYLNNWKNSGFNEVMFFDTLDSSVTLAGFLIVIYNTFAEGIPLLGWDGTFGQGTDGIKERKWWKSLYMIVNDDLYPPLNFILNNYLPSGMRNEIVRWINWAVGMGLDFVEALWISADDIETGVEGDHLALPFYWMKLYLAGAFVVGDLVALLVKAARKDSSGALETSASAWDWVIASVLTTTLVVFPMFKFGFFDEQLLRAATGVDWPGPETDKVEPFLPIGTDDMGKKILKDGEKQPVRLFADADDVMHEGDNKYFPESVGGDFGQRRAKDEAERKTKSRPSKQAYTLTQLLNRAAVLSGLMAMAAVRYEAATDKSKVREIFKDWNLDYRTEEEWGWLMDEAAGDQAGLLVAAERWWTSIQAFNNDKEHKKAVDTAAAARLGKVLGVKVAVPGKGVRVSLLYEDKTPMANADFEAVFGDGQGQRIVGRTDSDGVADIAPPDGHTGDFRLVLNSYPQEIAQGTAT